MASRDQPQLPPPVGKAHNSLLYKPKPDADQLYLRDPWVQEAEPLATAPQ
jgi:hypothetical protein